MQAYFEHSVKQDSVMRQRTIDRWTKIRTGATPALDVLAEAPPQLNAVLIPHIDQATLSAMNGIT